MSTSSKITSPKITSSKITVSAFEWVPTFAQGQVRDLRVRWALEEAGIAYEERLLGPGDQAEEKASGRQPFGQVPVYQEGELTLFESGAILLHIAKKSEVLMPRDPNAQARMVTWMFAALNSIEPFVMNLIDIDVFSAGQEWAKLRRPAAMEILGGRLGDLAGWMEGREYLEERFTAADLLMASVLGIPRHTTLLSDFPVLAVYHERCVARPAHARALAAQMAVFAQHAPT